MPDIDPELVPVLPRTAAADGGHLSIGGCDAVALAEEFGTPTYVYDQTRIEGQIEKLRAFAVIRYAQKACSNLAILDLMRRRGVLAVTCLAPAAREDATSTPDGKRHRNARLVRHFCFGRRRRGRRRVGV